MSERNDRSIPGRGPLVITLMAVVLLAAGGGGYLWFRMAGAPETVSTLRQEGQTNAPAASDELFPATLFVPGDGALGTMIVSVRRHPEAQQQAREAAAALLAAETEGGRSPVLRELRLRALYLDASWTATVDIASASPTRKEIRASAEDELLAVYALVNTLIQNVPEVRQVRFLVDGREAQTLAGHVDLSRAFVKRTDLVKP